MIASEILAKGVERGIITAEQAERLRALECLLGRRQVEQVVGGVLDVAVSGHEKAARPRRWVLNNFPMVWLEQPYRAVD